MDNKYIWIAFIALMVIYHMTKNFFGGNAKIYFLVLLAIFYLGSVIYLKMVKNEFKKNIDKNLTEEELKDELGEELYEEIADDPKFKKDKLKRNIFDVFVGIPLIVIPNIIYFKINDIDFTWSSNLTGINILLLGVGFILFLIGRKLVIGNFKD